MGSLHMLTFTCSILCTQLELLVVSCISLLLLTCWVLAADSQCALNALAVGIPIEKVSSDESEKLIKMEETLHTRVIGQEEAVVAISRAIRRARVGM